MDKVKEKQKGPDGAPFTEGWLASQQELIRLVNTGKVTMRTRGRKRKHLIKMMQELQKKTVDAYVREGQVAKEKYRAVMLTTWKERNPGRDPRADGHLLKQIRIPGKGLCECILFRRLPVGEYDLELEAAAGTLLSERHDDGERTIREGQQMSKFNELASQITGGVDAAQAQPLPEVRNPSLATSSAGIEDEKEVEEIVDSEVSDDDDEEEESMAHLNMSILGTLLTKSEAVRGSSSARGRSSSKPATQPSTRGTPPTSSKPPRRENPKSRQPSPNADAGPSKDSHAKSGNKQPVRQPSPMATEEQKCKGRGKGSKIPVDVQGVLEYYEIPALVTKITTAMAPTLKTPFSSVLDSPAAITEFDQKCPDIATALLKVYGEFVAVDNKMTKREFTPQEALEEVRKYRCHATTLQKIFTQVCKRDFEGETVHTSLMELSKDYNIGCAVYIRVFKQRLADYMRFGRGEEMAALIDKESNTLPTGSDCKKMRLQVIRNVVGQAVEAGLAKLFQGVLSRNREQDVRLIEWAGNVCKRLAKDQYVCSTDRADLGKLAVGLNMTFTDKTIEDVLKQEEAFEHCVNLRNSATYNGILKESISQRQFGTVKKVVEKETFLGPFIAYLPAAYRRRALVSACIRRLVMPGLIYQ